jgi:hypothetical protein
VVDDKTGVKTTHWNIFGTENGRTWTRTRDLLHVRQAL